MNIILKCYFWLIKGFEWKKIHIVWKISMCIGVLVIVCVCECVCVCVCIGSYIYVPRNVEIYAI